MTKKSRVRVRGQQFGLDGLPLRETEPRQSAREWKPPDREAAERKATERRAAIAVHHPPVTFPLTEPGQLLATDTTDAKQTMLCAVCPHQIQPGDRIARLLSGDWVHTGCVGK